MLCLWWYFLVAGGYKLRTGGTVNIVWNTGEKKKHDAHLCSSNEFFKENKIK